MNHTKKTYIGILLSFLILVVGYASAQVPTCANELDPGAPPYGTGAVDNYYTGCTYGCTAEDVKPISYEVVDSSGNSLNCRDCPPGGGTVDAFLKVTFLSTATERYNVFFLYSINDEPHRVLIKPIISSGATETIEVPIPGGYDCTKPLVISGPTATHCPAGGPIVRWDNARTNSKIWKPYLDEVLCWEFECTDSIAKCYCNGPVTIYPAPKCGITVPPIVCADASGITASVAEAQPVGPTYTYVWEVTGGTITDGQGTPSITWTAGSAGKAVVKLTITGTSGDEVPITCTRTCEEDVDIVAEPVVSVTPVTVCPGEPTKMTASVQAGYACPGTLLYQWYTGQAPLADDSNKISGANSADYSPDASGDYCCKITCGGTGGSGCSGFGYNTLTIRGGCTLTPGALTVCPGVVPTDTQIAAVVTGCDGTLTISEINAEAKSYLASCTDSDGCTCSVTGYWDEHPGCTLTPGALTVCPGVVPTDTQIAAVVTGCDGTLTISNIDAATMSYKASCVDSDGCVCEVTGYWDEFGGCTLDPGTLTVCPGVVPTEAQIAAVVTGCDGTLTISNIDAATMSYKASCVDSDGCVCEVTGYWDEKECFTYDTAWGYWGPGSICTIDSGCSNNWGWYTTVGAEDLYSGVTASLIPGASSGESYCDASRSPVGDATVTLAADGKTFTLSIPPLDGDCTIKDWHVWLSTASPCPLKGFNTWYRGKGYPDAENPIKIKGAEITGNVYVAVHASTICPIVE